MVTESLVVGIVSALLGGFVGYIFAIRAARRQSRRESKEQAYGSIFPSIRESIDIMGQILANEDLNLTDGDKWRTSKGRSQQWSRCS